MEYIYDYEILRQAINKEDINANTNEMMSEIASKKIKVSIDEIKTYLIKNKKM